MLRSREGNLGIGYKLVQGLRAVRAASRVPEQGRGSGDGVVVNIAAAARRRQRPPHPTGSLHAAR